MENMAALKWLSLAKNAIYTLVDPRSFPHLEVFDASYNPYKCDCHLKKFVEFMRNPRAVTITGQNSREYHQRYQVENRNDYEVICLILLSFKILDF